MPPFPFDRENRVGGEYLENNNLNHAKMKRKTVILCVFFGALVNLIAVDSAMKSIKIEALKLANDLASLESKSGGAMPLEQLKRIGEIKTPKSFFLVTFPIATVAMKVNKGELGFVPRIAQALLWGVAAGMFCWYRETEDERFDRRWERILKKSREPS